MNVYKLLMSEDAHKKETLNAIYLAGAVLCYASVPLFLKHFSATIDPWTVNAVRYTVGTLIWLPAVVLLRRHVPEGRSVWKDAMFPAAINICGQVAWAMLPYPPFNNDASVTGFVVRLSFLFAILFGFCVSGKERMLAGKSVFWAGVLLSVFGLYLLYHGSIAFARATPLGIFMIVVVALFWGAYGVSVHRFMEWYPTRLAFGVISLYTAGGLILLMLVNGNPASLVHAEAGNLALLVLSGIIGISMSHVMMYRSIKWIGPVLTSGAMMTAPFVTVLGAMLFLGESMSGLQWTGGVILVASGLMLVTAKRETTVKKRS